MELKDSIHNFVESVVMSLGSKSLSDVLTAFKPECTDKDVIRD